MGRVWRATDVVLHREVAIKELVPPPGLTPGERQEMRERSLREARAIARLNNINVVRVFDVLRTDADPWIVMEYVPSRSLQDTLAADGPYSPVRAAEIGLGVLNALRAAHRAGVVHRDVKPGNVLIGADGRVVLTDFGLATVPGDPNVTRTGLVLGSPAYIAPERARDGSAGPAADLWSLGATLYAAVEGASPFARPSAIATLAALATENPPPARNAGPMKPVLNGLLRKDPTHRINAEEAERLLLRAAGRRSKLSFPMSPTMRRPGAGRDRSALTTGTSSAPVVPGPRPPVARPSGRTVTPAPGRPAGPPQPPVTPGRPAAGEGRPVYAPGKAPVGRPAAEIPTRVDSPKVDAPRLDATRVDGPKIDATRVDGPPVQDDKTTFVGTRPGAPATPGQPSTPDAPRSGPQPSGGLSRTARGAQAGFTAADVAANRRGTAAPEHERSLSDATSLLPRVKPDEPAPADPTTRIALPPRKAKPAAEPADKTTKISEPVDRTAKVSEPADKTTTIAAPVDRTTKISMPAERTTKSAEPADKSTKTAEPATTTEPAEAEPTEGEPAKAEPAEAASVKAEPSTAEPAPDEHDQNEPAERDRNEPAERDQNEPAEQDQNEPAEQDQNEPAEPETADAEQAKSDGPAGDTEVPDGKDDQPPAVTATPVVSLPQDAPATDAKTTRTKPARRKGKLAAASKVAASPTAQPEIAKAGKPADDREAADATAESADGPAAKNVQAGAADDNDAVKDAPAETADQDAGAQHSPAATTAGENGNAKAPADAHPVDKTAKLNGPDPLKTTRLRSDAGDRPDATVLVPAARSASADEPLEPMPAFNRPNRPAWTPMPVRQSPGITVFGTRLTYGQAAVAGGILLLIIVLVVVLIGVLGRDGGGDDEAQPPVTPTASAGGQPSQQQQPTSAATTGSSPSPAPSSAPPSSPAAQALPTTWQVYTDDSGFKVPLPKSASISNRGSETRIEWNNRLLLIDQTDDPKPDALADWQQQERDRAGRDYRNYEKVRLQSVGNYFKQAADWEFFYTTSSGNPQHAVKRNIIVSDNQAYSISWYVSPDDWNAAQSDLKRIYQGFKPKP